MSGYLIDTDVLINFLRGIENSRLFLSDIAMEEVAYCSVITIAEILAGMKPQEKPRIDALIDGLEILPVTLEIAQKAAQYKKDIKSHALELDDCLIAATAYIHRKKLATCNTKHFPMDDITKIRVAQ